MNKQKLICGLDISTAAAGWCQMLENGKLLNYGSYKFDKPSEYTNLDLVEQFDEHIWPNIQYGSTVVLEDSLRKYQGGFSSKATISKLLRFNGIIEYELQKRLGKDRVVKIHPSTAKAESFLNRGRVPSDYQSPWSTYKDSKAWVIEEAENEFDSFDYELTHAENPSPRTDDICDAIVLASSYVN